MSTSNWDPSAVKALLRLTTQRLGQLEAKKDSQAQSIRREVAILLKNDNLRLARTKTQNLLQEDALGDVLEVVEMQVGVVLERFSELEGARNPSAAFVEAASSIIYAAPHLESNDLNAVRDVLVQRLNPTIVRSIVDNHESHTPKRITQALSASLPSAERVNECMMKIAQAHDVKWQPEPLRQNIIGGISDILNIQSTPLVDLPRLRKLCAQGLPDDPPWLRPRIWKLFFGILPVLKSSWGTSISKQRECYYDLVRRLLPPLTRLPPPTSPLTGPDAVIVGIADSVSRVPLNLFRGLDVVLDATILGPLSEVAEEDIRIDCANNLDTRLHLIRHQNEEALQTAIVPSIPEIRLHNSVDDQENSPDQIGPFSSRRPGAPTSLPAGKLLNDTNAKPHGKHLSALYRLLYLHSCLNPANQSPHIPSILVPLYSVLLRETEYRDLAHAEADTFWLFEAIIGEISELEDEEAGKIWMKKVSERLRLVDPELAADLHAKGLDPALPHYSYSWLACLFTKTLPMASVLPVWDVMFSLPARTRDTNAKLEFLVDMCTSLLIRARAPLLRLGKQNGNMRDLWADEHARRPPPSPLRPWELSDAFLQGMSLLQFYPIEAAGGVDGVLGAASDMASRREEESRNPKPENLSFGARIKDTMWRGFTNQVASAESLEEDEEEDEEDTESEDEDTRDEGNETETPPTLGLTSRLATTVWRGITNQSSMDDSPSPPEPLSPSPSPRSNSPLPLPSEGLQRSPSPQPPNASPLWNYTGKLRESDTVASLAKVSSNWRARAMDAWTSRKGSITPASPSSPASTTSELPQRTNSWVTHSKDRFSISSLPEDPVSPYSPPPRPKHFRPPRESFLPQPRRIDSSAPHSPELAIVPEYAESMFMHKTKASLASLAGLNNPAPPPQSQPKSGPRPLLLSSHSLLTAHNGSTSVAQADQWSEVLRAKTHALRQGSLSSVSSFSPSESIGKPHGGTARSQWDSDGGRKVAINRKSVSPMAPAFRNWKYSKSAGTLSDIGSPLNGVSHLRQDSVESTQGRGWRSVENYDSPATSSPPVPPTLVTESGVVVTGPESNGVPVSPSQIRRARKKTPPPVQVQSDDTSDSSSFSPASTSPRIRSKRYAPRLANLRIRENSRSNVTEQKSPNSNSLAPVWSEEQDLAPTPRAVNFGTDNPLSASPTSPRSFRTRKTSGEGSEVRASDSIRVHKISPDSASPRVRKISTGSREARRHRESVADEGDDEGYDDLLSAYESEESVMNSENMKAVIVIDSDDSIL